MILSAIRTALSGVYVADFKTYPNAVGPHTLPALFVGQPTSIAYETAYGGRAEITWPIDAVVPRTDETAAQRLLDAAMSNDDDSSVVNGLRALDGPWRSLTVNSVGEPEGIQVEQTEAVRVTFVVTIRA